MIINTRPGKVVLTSLDLDLRPITEMGLHTHKSTYKELLDQLQAILTNLSGFFFAKNSERKKCGKINLRPREKCWTETNLG